MFITVQNIMGKQNLQLKQYFNPIILFLNRVLRIKISRKYAMYPFFFPHFSQEYLLKTIISIPNIHLPQYLYMPVLGVSNTPIHQFRSEFCISFHFVYILYYLNLLHC